MMISIDSVSATVAIASGPSFDTQKMSATAKTDSITISSTIGTASSRIARPQRQRREVVARAAQRFADEAPEAVAAGRGDLGRYGGGGGLGRGHRRGSFTSTTNGRPPNRQAPTKKLRRRTPLPAPLPASRGEGTGFFSLSRLRERVGVRAGLVSGSVRAAIPWALSGRPRARRASDRRPGRASLAGAESPRARCAG